MDFGRHVIPLVREEVAKRDATRRGRRLAAVKVNAPPPRGSRSSASRSPTRVSTLLRELGDEYTARYGRDAHAELAATR